MSPSTSRWRVPTHCAGDQHNGSTVDCDPPVRNRLSRRSSHAQAQDTRPGVAGGDRRHRAIAPARTFGRLRSPGTRGSAAAVHRAVSGALRHVLRRRCRSSRQDVHGCAGRLRRGARGRPRNLAAGVVAEGVSGRGPGFGEPSSGRASTGWSRPETHYARPCRSSPESERRGSCWRNTTTRRPRVEVGRRHRATRLHPVVAEGRSQPYVQTPEPVAMTRLP
jgi:hypothetical protein